MFGSKGSKHTPRSRRWKVFQYGMMALIVLGLLLLLHLVSSIQDARSPERRWDLAKRLIEFDLPEGYRLTSALYAIHPRFFVLSEQETGQRIRVAERTWWSPTRTPEEFKERFWHPGTWVRKQPLGFGYEAILVDATGELVTDAGKVPYVTGLLDAESGQRAENALAACLYSEEQDKSILIFGSAQADIFDPTEVKRFIESLSFPEE